MTKEKFENLLKEAGFKTQNEFASYLGLTPKAISDWKVGRNPFPKYLEIALTWAIKAKKYNEANNKDLTKHNLELLKLKLNSLKAENIALKEEVEFLNSLKKKLKRLIEKSLLIEKQ